MAFPAGRYDDQVDALSQGLARTFEVGGRMFVGTGARPLLTWPLARETSLPWWESLAPPSLRVRFAPIAAVWTVS